MTYQPKPGDKVTVRVWATHSLEPGATRSLYSEHSGTVAEARPGQLQLAGSEQVVTLGAARTDSEAEPLRSYRVTEVHLQPSELPGRHVRIRRYATPSSEVTGGAVRVLDCDVEGMVAAVVERGRLVELNPLTARVHYVSDGHDDKMPFGAAWRIGLGYVFLGQDPEHGGSWTLDTEVEVDPEPEPRDLAEAIDATPPGQAFTDRELLNIARLGLSRIYTAPADEASDGMRECARQALARLEGRQEL